MTHPDLRAEQAYIDRAYDRLEAMRRAAEDLRDSVISEGKGGTFQARVERDVFVQTSLQRLEQLQLGRSSLCFGRIDRELDGEQDGVESFYVGRLAVSDEQQEPLVVDWRAPVAEAFYRATGRSTMGLRLRRHFATDGRVLIGIEDELFRSNGDGDDDDLELVGPGALLVALQRSRSGQMRDIVATVQREQDEIIRGELPGILVVQGGPGTGKTAVALHRAAYLLYTYRFPLEQQGVLVVGPNQLFLRYIEQVLPSLGESGVALTTITGLMPAVRPRRVESALTARVKGDARMAAVLAQAVTDRERPLRDHLSIGFGAVTLTVSADTTRSIVRTGRRRPGPHNARRRQVEAMLLRALHDQYVHAVGRGRRTGIGGGLTGPDGFELDYTDFASQVRREPAVVAALDRMWPLLTPEDLLNDLFGAPALLALATRDILTPEERDALGRTRAHSLEDASWSADDIPLLDEAKALLGAIKRTRRVEAEDEPRGYGHIVVDEAQDLTPMAMRMLGRRSISGSMTLVGDIGQATGSHAPAGWTEVIADLPHRRPPRVAALTVNYRTPAEIMEVAAGVIAAAGVVGIDPPRPVRATGRMPDVRSVTAGGFVDEVVLAAGAEMAAVAPGTVAIIAAPSYVPAVAAALEASGLPWGDPERTGLTAPVTLLDVADAKGLEFDSVVVAEPSAIVDEAAQGLRALYVALTRTTRRLAVVHATALPGPLVDALAAARTSGGERPAIARQQTLDL